jgi:hypothetical protein
MFDFVFKYYILLAIALYNTKQIEYSYSVYSILYKPLNK